MKRNAWIGLTAVAVVLAGGAAVLVLRGGKDEMKFRMAPVDKGSVTQRISATGTINALIQVPVGTQVSGVVTALYADFNSLVKKGQVIAQIDPTPWLTNLKDAEAGLQRAEASLANAKADYRRNKALFDAKLLAQADLDSKELALKTATAQVASSRATVTKARTDLGYCTLKAPVDGVVVSRVVDVGQTVAASFSTPNVFTIAQDLSKMKVQAAIDEADIGQVRVGQRAFFTVDSYPDKQFQGVVSEVQLNPVVNQNVVTYNVVMEVTNEPRTAYAPEGGQGPGAGARAGAPEGAPHHGHGPAPQAGQGPQGRSGPGAEGWHGRGGRGGEGRPGGGAPEARSGKAAGLVAPEVATIETNTARYIPAGSAVYKGNLALFPGMTANCTIVTNRRQDVLRVPSSALRFNPAAFAKMGDKKAPMGPGGPGGPRPGGPAGGQARQGASVARGMVAKREDHVWVLDNAGKPKMMVVKAGISDGQYTEISGDGVFEGLKVLTGVEDPAKKAAAQGPSPLGGPGGRR